MRCIGVKAGVFIVAALIVLGFASCKKSCYTCSQYCAYCLNSDSLHILELCSAQVGDVAVQDSFSHWEQSGYRCTKLNNSTNFCDSKNGADAAVTYYEKENYFCYPQQ